MPGERILLSLLTCRSRTATSIDIDQCRFSFTLNKAKLRIKRRHEGRYLLRSNLTDDDPAKLWQYYMQLTEVEQALKELKHDLQVRPIHHQKDERIEAHIFLTSCTFLRK